MMIQTSIIVSKFNYKVYLIPIVIVLFWSAPIISGFFITNKNYGLVERIISLSILPLIVVLISLYQLKNNLIITILTEDSITFRKYLGYGKPNIYHFNDLDGYRIQLKKSKGEEYEILKIVKNKKVRLKISQFYIDNYSDLKLNIGQKLSIVSE